MGISCGPSSVFALCAFNGLPGAEVLPANASRFFRIWSKKLTRPVSAIIGPHPLRVKLTVLFATDLLIAIHVVFCLHFPV